MASAASNSCNIKQHWGVQAFTHDVHNNNGNLEEIEQQSEGMGPEMLKLSGRIQFLAPKELLPSLDI